ARSRNVANPHRTLAGHPLEGAGVASHTPRRTSLGEGSPADTLDTSCRSLRGPGRRRVENRAPRLPARDSAGQEHRHVPSITAVPPAILCPIPPAARACVGWDSDDGKITGAAAPPTLWSRAMSGPTRRLRDKCPGRRLNLGCRARLRKRP